MHRFVLVIGCITVLQLASRLNAVPVSEETSTDPAVTNKKTVTSSPGVVIVESEANDKKNATTENDEQKPHTLTTWTKENMGMLKRGFYVLLVLTAIIALYFGIRIYRTRNRKVKKYGLLSSGGGERIGLNPIDSDSEDDYTVFETKTLH